jgi:release factor glutamine methyltransferase
VTAIDISAESLKIASKNLFVNEVMVHFHEMNILDPESYDQLGNFDVIVSNPPYVTESEKELMAANVLKYEPHHALFVADSDPLLFYNAILYFADEKLVQGGRVYFEINEKYGTEVKSLLEKSGFDQVVIHKDIHGKNRFVTAVKPE